MAPESRSTHYPGSSLSSSGPGQRWKLTTNSQTPKASTPSNSSNPSPPSPPKPPAQPPSSTPPSTAAPPSSARSGTSPHPHITRHFKTFFHDTTFYTIFPAATCRLDRFIGNPSIGSITSPARLREVMAQVAYLAGALAMIHDIPCRPGAGRGEEGELSGMAQKKKTGKKKGFHLDI